MHVGHQPNVIGQYSKTTEKWTEPEIWTCQRIDKEAKAITQDINDALKASCHKTYIKAQKRQPIWWSESLKNHRREVRALHNTARKSGQDEHWERYRACRKEYKQLIRSVERSSWKAYLQELEEVKDAAKLFKNIGQN